jgi:uncharacterized protein
MESIRQPDKTDPGQLVLRPRDVRFDWSGLPLGERWFVSVFKRALPLITDETLREDVIGFIGQETIHAEAHQGVLDYFAGHGLDPAPYTRQMEWLFRRILGPRPGLSEAQAREELIEHVALVAAIEHFTAFLGDWILHTPELDQAGAHPVMLDLLRWHGAEEVEHRNVAFDLMVHLDPRYARRIRAMLMAGPASARHYLRRDYHPSQQFSTRLAVAYLGSSPAARAAER